VINPDPEVKMTFESCFICQPKQTARNLESPFKWIEPRPACSEHGAQAVLANGERVSSFLARDRAEGEFPLEGGGLNYCLNPVFIDGIKGWTDFAAGGWAVIEEIFPSHNYFEFVVQHSSEKLDFLYNLYKNKEQFADGVNQRALLTLISQNPDGFNEQLLGLCRVWETDSKIRQYLTETGKTFFESPAEAVNLLSNIKSDSFDLAQVVPELVGISIRRFSHLEIDK
jgi:hypothetical protein